jgi:hypothetical protein
MYTKAAMILRMLKRYGDHRFIGAPLTSIRHGQRTAEGPPRCEPVLVDQFQLQPHTIREEPFPGAELRGADEHLELVNKTSAVFVTVSSNEAQQILI